MALASWLADSAWHLLSSARMVSAMESVSYLRIVGIVQVLLFPGNFPQWMMATE